MLALPSCTSIMDQILVIKLMFEYKTLKNCRYSKFNEHFHNQISITIYSDEHKSFNETDNDNDLDNIYDYDTSNDTDIGNVSDFFMIKVIMIKLIKTMLPAMARILAMSLKSLHESDNDNDDIDYNYATCNGEDTFNISEVVQ